eukprot:g468.t1
MNGTSLKDVARKLLRVINQNRQNVSARTMSIVPLIIKKNPDLLSALRSIPYDVTLAPRGSLHRIVLLTKIALAKLLQEDFPSMLSDQEPNMRKKHLSIERRRSIDELFSRIRSIEKEPTESDSKDELLDEAESVLPLKVRSKMYRGSMVSLRQADSDAYIIPAMARLMSMQDRMNDSRNKLRDVTGTGDVQNYSRQTSDISSESPRTAYVNKTEWKSAYAPNGRIYYYSTITGESSWYPPPKRGNALPAEARSGRIDREVSTKDVSAIVENGSSGRVGMHRKEDISKGAHSDDAKVVDEAASTIQRNALSVASDAISANIHALESEKAKWALQKRKMENEIATLKAKVEVGDEKIAMEHSQVEKLQLKLDSEHLNSVEQVREAEERASKHLLEKIDSLKQRVSSADGLVLTLQAKVDELKNEKLATDASLLSDAKDGGSMTKYDKGESVLNAALALKRERETRSEARKLLMKRQRAMSVPSALYGGHPDTNVTAGVFPGPLAVKIKKAAGVGDEIHGANAAGSTHLAGIDGHIESIATKKGVRSKVVALDGWQLWELSFAKAFVVETFLQLRFEYAEMLRKKEEKAEPSRRRSRFRSRARSRARTSLPCPYPPLEPFSIAPKKGAFVKMWWDPIKPHALTGSVWESIGWNVSKKVDLSALGRDFSTSKKSGGSSGAHAKSRGTHRRGHLGSLETKMWIPFRKLRWTIETLKDRMGMNEEQQMDLSESSGLSKDNVRMLRNLLPTPDVLSRLSSVPREALTQMETFIVDMCEAVPDLGRRLRAIDIYWTFENNATEHELRLMRTFEAAKAVLSSRALVDVLHAVRTIGNYVNFESKLGSQYAFSITSLERLASMRQTSNKNKTMVDFLVAEFHRLSPSTLRLPEEIRYVEKVEGSSFSDITSATSKLGVELKFVQTLYNDLESQGDEPLNAAFLNTFESWLDDATRVMSSLRSVDSELQESMKSVIRTFCPGCGNEEALKALQALRRFSASFLAARRELEARLKRQQKRT